MSGKIYKYVFWILLVLSLVGSALFYFHEMKNRERIAELNSVISIQAETIEISKGVYQKQSVTISNLTKTISVQDSIIDNLVAVAKSQQAKISSLNQLVVYWKKAYEGAVDASQTEEGEVSVDCKEECKKLRTRVEFKKDFGFIGVSGHTLTNPAEGFVKVEQLRPLRLAVAVVQNKNKQWSALVSSSEENVGVDIQLSSVDPFLEKEKWYQKIGLVGSVGAGSGLMSAIGVTYRIENVDFGPVYGFYAGDKTERFFGLSIAWKPFAK